MGELGADDCLRWSHLFSLWLLQDLSTHSSSLFPWYCSYVGCWPKHSARRRPSWRPILHLDFSSDVTWCPLADNTARSMPCLSVMTFTFLRKTSRFVFKVGHWESRPTGGGRIAPRRTAMAHWHKPIYHGIICTMKHVMGKYLLTFCIRVEDNRHWIWKQRHANK